MEIYYLKGNCDGKTYYYDPTIGWNKSLIEKCMMTKECAETYQASELIKNSSMQSQLCAIRSKVFNDGVLTSKD